MAVREHRLSFPLTEADARNLRAGDLVTLDGEIVITAGMPTHERLLRCLDGHEPLPMALQEASVMHLGSFSRDMGERFEVLYLNPTTSTRFNPFMPRLLRGFRWHAVGGKGGLDAASAEALQEVGGVYLSFLGGGCTLLSHAVQDVVEVGWRDMLTHYRLVRLKVQGLGPATVGIDAQGRSLYDEEKAAAQARRAAIVAQMDAARG
ncbi:fumarate hydratase C-terminal domain-containing protein [uncultured Pseudacidovorax sp.]|uniref:fumarate hydratase C-terminal domain-containing protein n=1 Tax=uncultured Pseudacidovorax sp. TaxID=679313 RepID=UPI0025F80D3F|nr:fumarate hydratase C-terminal domain-containing protein [uncultured Pseudacidovorax sp.]